MLVADLTAAEEELVAATAAWEEECATLTQQHEEAVAAAAKAAGYSDIYTQKLIGIGEMEKLMGKDKFKELLGSLIVKPAGKPTLVPVADKRPALASSRAEDEFKNLEGIENG